MKSLLVLLCVVGATLAALKISPHLEAAAKQLHKACVEQTNVDEKYINQTRGGYVPDNPELKCYMLCLLEHVGAIDEEGTIDFTIIDHMMAPDLKESMNFGQQNCATKHGDTRCETAYLTFKCYHELMPEGAELP